jgi:hypothetical protein
MDSSFVTALAAVLGSLFGAAASIMTTWITQRTQAARAQREGKLRDRETLYGEFITEASRLAVEALGHSLEQPDTFVKLYGLLGRIRLLATDPVLTAAELSCRQIVELYSGPTMTVEQFRSAVERGRLDPLREFSAVCRKELQDLSAAP